MKLKWIKWLMICLILLGLRLMLSGEGPTEKYETTTENGARFLIEETSMNGFPDDQYSYNVYEISGGESIQVLKDALTEEKDAKIEFVFSNDDFVSYSFNEYFLYKRKGASSYESIVLFVPEYKEEYLFLMPGFIQFAKSDLYGALSLRYLLVQSKNEVAVQLIRQYARGEFTEEMISRDEARLTGEYSLQAIKTDFQEALDMYGDE